MMEDDHVSLHYKYWTTDDDWKPAPDDAPLELFRLDLQNRQILPRWQPELVTPMFDLRTDFESLEASILAQKDIFPPGREIALYKWWQDWCDHNNKEEKFAKTTEMWNNMATTWDWPLSSYQPFAEKQQENAEDDQQGSNQLRDLRQREMATPEVVSKPRSMQLLLRGPIEHCVNYMAVYSMVRNRERRIGKIMNAHGENKVQMRQFACSETEVWSPQKGRNSTQVVPILKVHHIFKINKAGTITQRVRDILEYDDATPAAAVDEEG
jgi:hypothetical protein